MSDSSPNARQVYSDFIDELRAMGRAWEDVYLADGDDEDEISTSLKLHGKKHGLQKSDYYTPDQWKQLVKEKEEREKHEKQIGIAVNQPLLGHDAVNNFVLSNSRASMWKLYLRALEKKGFSSQSINNLVQSTQNILLALNPSTQHNHPFKGLVMGNVQSGKTANMAGLISAAADNGFNMFIVLSGMIESLRIQTEDRFKSDLIHDKSNITWQIFTHLGPMGSNPLSSCNFKENCNFRYMTVVLKNADRLDQLIKWLKSDPNKLSQMKIMIIDDEADQASPNTKDISTAEVTTINELIKNLVFSSYWTEGQIPAYPKAVNYIGFTATPFANVLNEAGPDSLFPSDMIYSLPVSSEYFGPQQIFGLRDEYFSDDEDSKIAGLDIVNTISKDDIALVNEAQKGETTEFPESLQDSICWFLCSVAALRYRKKRKPFTMLIHTSQSTFCHKELGDLVFNWLNTARMDTLLERCRAVWKAETKKLTFEKFKEVMEDYPIGQVENYPDFDHFKPELIELIKEEAVHINIDSDMKPAYGNGIHLCIDNSTNNGITEDNEYLRLLYPKTENMPEKAPAFLVIGGTTLSRGLTLEGLISSYFLRTTKNGDTLMQMGRWFGYRKGYELYPRIWMSANARLRFEYLSVIDYDLRRTIQNMVNNLKTPGEVGVMVRQSPSKSLLQLTAKNKMQSAVPASRNFTGFNSQTKLFDQDRQIQQHNLALTENFLQELTHLPEGSFLSDSHAKVWYQVPSSMVCDYLQQFHFQKNLKLSRYISSLISWIRKQDKEEKMKPWNIVLPSRKDNTSQWGIEPYRINMVVRSRLNDGSGDANVINVGAVKTLTDTLADVRHQDGFEEAWATVKSLPATEGIDKVRKMMKADDIPQLIIYIIDKDSQPKKPDQINRLPLDSFENLVGLNIAIPGTTTSTDYVDYLSVLLPSHEEFADEADINEG